MPCPICQKDTVHKYRPFCSVECSNRDLHNWLHEAYSLEVDDEDLEKEISAKDRAAKQNLTGN